jgi:hypothetical protein
MLGDDSNVVGFCARGDSKRLLEARGAGNPRTHPHKSEGGAPALAGDGRRLCGGIRICGLGVGVKKEGPTLTNPRVGHPLWPEMGGGFAVGFEYAVWVLETDGPTLANPRVGTRSARYSESSLGFDTRSRLDSCETD